MELLGIFDHIDLNIHTFLDNIPGGGMRTTRTLTNA